MTDEDNAEKVIERKVSRLNKITPFSKYLAMLLFILMPFIGGWIGYSLAPEKVIFIEKTTIPERDEEDNEKLEMIDDLFIINESYWDEITNFEHGKLYVLEGQSLPQATEIFAAGPLILISNSTQDDINLIRNEFEEIYEMDETDGYRYEVKKIEDQNAIKIEHPALSWGGVAINYFFEEDDTFLKILHYPYIENSTSTNEFMKFLETNNFFTESSKF